MGQTRDERRRPVGAPRSNQAAAGRFLRVCKLSLAKHFGTTILIERQTDRQHTLTDGVVLHVEGGWSQEEGQIAAQNRVDWGTRNLVHMSTVSGIFADVVKKKEEDNHTGQCK